MDYFHVHSTFIVERKQSLDQQCFCW